jgi:hypothetical protein
MVDSVNNSSANSALRAQQIASAQALNATRSPPAVINQTKAAAVVPVKASATPQTLVISSKTILPRGSIVDKKV